MPKVKIYSTPVCPYCSALKSFLIEHNIEFEDIDISQNEKKQKEIIEKTGQMKVPIVEIDNKIIAGFDKEKISELLNV